MVRTSQERCRREPPLGVPDVGSVAGLTPKDDLLQEAHESPTATSRLYAS